MTAMHAAQIVDSHPAAPGAICDVCQDYATATLILSTTYGLREVDVCAAGEHGAEVVEVCVALETSQRELEASVSAIADPWSDGTALARIRRA